MRSARSVLALRYTPVSVAGGVRNAVGGFLRYVQFRDQHAEPEKGGLDAYMRYVSHRDRSSPAGRVFSRDQARMDVDRRQLVAYVLRSTKGLAPKWVHGRDGKLEDRQRAVYQFILSPEDWRGLDLRNLARAAMKQLEADAGAGGIGPWFAAEHRNTDHHHVHIVLAARRELEAGKFSTLVINRRRLQAMKDAIALEIERQRGREPERGAGGRSTMQRSQIAAPTRVQLHVAPRWRPQPPARRLFGVRPRSIRQVAGATLFGATLLRLRGVAIRYQQQMERELEEELARRERGGWTR